MSLAVAELVQPLAKEPPELPKLPSVTPYQHPEPLPTVQMQRTPAWHLSALTDSTNWIAGNTAAQEEVVQPFFVQVQEKLCNSLSLQVVPPRGEEDKQCQRCL